MKHFITAKLCLLSVVLLVGQSEFVEKGNDAIELDFIHVFASGKDLNGMALAINFGGKTDFGLQFGSAGEGGIFIPSLAHHIGGNNGQLGLAAFAGYVIQS